MKPKTKPDAAQGTHWIDRLKATVPTREMLAAHPWLKPYAHHVLDPRLWRVQQESVARGAAIGVFWAFAIPVAQFAAAAAHSIWWRANIPVAAGVTLITNPLTLGFWLWLAYQVGALIVGAPAPGPLRADNIREWLTSYGGPALLGMGIFAVCGAVAAYLLVKLGWRLRIWFKRRNR